MIKVIGSYLYQWDSNRQLLLTGDLENCSQVHFAHLFQDDKALVVEVKDVDGQKVADIPNLLLMDGSDIWAWAWKEDHTLSGKRLEVTRRTKPSTYIYTPSEVLSYEELKKWLEEELAKLKPEGISDYTNLTNKPSIEGIVLDGDKLMEDFGLKTIDNEVIDSWFK